jgi:hypothetical protein
MITHENLECYYCLQCKFFVAIKWPVEAFHCDLKKKKKNTSQLYKTSS